MIYTTYISFFSIIIVLIGALLGPITGYLDLKTKFAQYFSVDKMLESSHMTLLMQRVPHKTSYDSSGTIVLVIFTLFVLLFAGVTIAHYWSYLANDIDSVLFYGWLILTMIAGMIVQVVVSNYKTGKPLAKVTAAQLILPMLLSLLVFYPTWSIVTSSPHNYFSFYAAFLNGYFWQNAVASAKVPTGLTSKHNE